MRLIGRATQGVRLIEIDEKDRVVSLARLPDEVEDGPQTDSDPDVSA